MKRLHALETLIGMLEGREREGTRKLWLDMARFLMLFPAILEHTETGYMWEPVDNMALAVFWMSAGMTSRPRFSIRRKAAALLIPYLLMSLLCIAFTVWWEHEPFDFNMIEGVAYGRFKFWRGPLGADNPRLMCAYNGVLWYLPSFFLSYLVFALLIKVKGTAGNIAAVASCLLLTWLAGFLPVLLPWSLDTAPAFGAVIYMGRLLARSGITESRGLRLPAVVCVGCAALYILFNRLTGITNISLGDFGRSVFLWFPAAVAGASALILLCRMAGNSFVNRVGSVLNRGALFVFGMQLVFYKLAEEWYSPMDIESWKVRTLIGLLFCFAGGKLLDWLYRKAVRPPRSAPPAEAGL